ncbi:MAG TPA: carboxypeptidase M32 [Alphaproteobacteria bacterium]|nr:carboxypeptidase M32 [Alphaproteobacteria bacterium]
MKAYDDLARRFARMSRVAEAAAMLQWDMAAVMPEGGAEARGAQLATLRVLAHEMLIDPAVEEGITKARADGGFDSWQKANLDEMDRAWHRAVAVPKDLVEAVSVAGSRCEMTWRGARAASDFARVLPEAENLLALTREKAQALAAALNLSPYDALLDGYEPGGRAADIDPIFADLAAFLPGFIAEAREETKRRGPGVRPMGPFPVTKQKALAEALMARLGFDFAHGRLDTSHHPFCGGVPDDVRLTTRYDEGGFVSGLMGVLHETGHALYEQGLPKAWRNQPVGEARGMSTHESQSLLMEMQACRSAEFLTFLAPLLEKAYGADPAFAPENLQRLYVKVEPGFIRVDADEATYPAHVILRYRLERAMIAGEMRFADLPAAWNERMKELLGLTPKNDAEGCLQDIHWYGGDFGYFPTYTLGAMTAAQLFAAARSAVSGLMASLAKGEFAPLVAWLRANVHGLASSLSTRAILERATGRPLSVEPFKGHLKARYLG